MLFNPITSHQQPNQMAQEKSVNVMTRQAQFTKDTVMYYFEY